MSSTKQWALITGASEGGIGDSLAREFAKNGVGVIASSRTTAKMQHLATVEGIETLQLDVSSAQSIRTAVEEVTRLTGGRLDYLVNNAGWGYGYPLLDVDIEEAKQMFDVNFFAIVAMTQACFPLLRVAKGVIVNNSSIAGTGGFPVPFISIYGASKAALNQLSDTMRVELAPFDIKVVNVITGNIQSKFWTNVSDTKLKADSVYQPIAKQIADAIGGGSAASMPKTESDVYARQIVSDVMKKSPNRWLWRGSMATGIWFLTCFAPRWFLDWAMRFPSGLDKLRPLLRAEEAKKQR